MSADLERARGDAAAGNYKRAVRRLWLVQADARTDGAVARGMLELAQSLTVHTDGKIRQECDTLRAYAESVLALQARDPTTDALVWVPRCRFLAGAGLPATPKNGSVWDLIFREDRVVLRGEQLIEFRWEDIGALEINGAGAVRRGVRWSGFGLGLQGAIEGALVAAALNSVTSTTTIDTIIRLESATSEAFFHYDELVPDELRRRLAPAFLRLRQTHPDPGTDASPASGEHWVDRLDKLAALHDRGMLSREEFDGLKARLLNETESDLTVQ